MARLRGRPRHQVADPAVSRAKFQREIDALRRNEQEYRRRGWLILRTEYPEIVLVLGVPRLTPTPLLFGVRLDYTNYDVEPPSVVLISPWTGESLRPEEVLVVLRQGEVRLMLPNIVPNDADAESAAQADAREGATNPDIKPKYKVTGGLLQWSGPGHTPFLCIRGVREYHRHPAHTGDSWLLHRGRGEGRAIALLDAIHNAGPAFIIGYSFGFNLQLPENSPLPPTPPVVSVRFDGFTLGEV